MNQKIAIIAAASLLTAHSAFAETELERLRKLAAEQELQIRALEEKVARLTENPPPKKSFKAVYPDTTTSASPEGELYIVQAGDSLERIAQNYKTNVESLAKLNGLDRSSVIQPNQKLRIPSPSNETVSKQQNVAKEIGLSHRVIQGDTFYKLSKKYNVTLAHLTKLNPKINPNALRIGQSVVIRAAKNPAELKAPIATSEFSTPPPSTGSLEKKAAVKITQEISYQAFAEQYGTTTAELDRLNGYQLDPSTVMAKGSELYVP